MPKQTYQYTQDQSIIYGLQNEYEITDEEYRMIYTFFVTYSLCKNLSWQKKNLMFYGWSGSYKNTIKNDIENILGSGAIVIVGNDKPTNTLKQEMIRHELANGRLNDFDKERAVILDKNQGNKFYNLCYHIRNCLAHGKFALVFGSTGKKMIIFQDDDGNNVTGRMVFSLKTLLSWIRIIDKNKIVYKIKEENDGTINC